MKLILDYETRSEADLKKVGAYEYSVHASTQILCVGWKLDDGPERVWSPAIPAPYGELIQALCNPKVELIAHNAFFEQVITRNVLSRIISKRELREIPISRWTCTAAMAAALALPRSLEGACLALKLPVQKDMEGRRLILKYCKPRKATKGNASKWHASKEDLLRIMEYCRTDIKAEYALLNAIPGLNPLEREVWELDQKINWRGFYVDRDLVVKILKMIDQETKKLDEETLALTAGEIETTNRRAKCLEILNRFGADLPDLKAQTVAHALKRTDLHSTAKRLLEIRQAVSKTSTAKYLAFELRSRSDSRIRDFLMYHGAGPGRWTGMGVQPQNFPRGTIKDSIQACEILNEGDLELVRMVYGNPMEVFASCLRGMIRASYE